MKKLLVAISMLFTLNAYADSWVMPNTGGGEITLTDQQCSADNGRYPALKKAYSWTNSVYFDGCWTIIDGNVHVVWVLPDGTRPRRVYNINSFYKKI